MDQPHRIFVTLRNALGVLLVVCLAWFAPMSAVAQTGSAPDAGPMIAMQVHCAMDASDMTRDHKGMAHQMTCCLACAETSFVGHFVMPILSVRAVRALWSMSDASFPTLAAPDPALRPPNSSSIA
jgi:hypothetical protein